MRMQMSIKSKQIIITVFVVVLLTLVCNVVILCNPFFGDYGGKGNFYEKPHGRWQFTMGLKQKKGSFACLLWRVRSLAFFKRIQTNYMHVHFFLGVVWLDWCMIIGFILSSR